MCRCAARPQYELHPRAEASATWKVNYFLPEIEGRIGGGQSALQPNVDPGYCHFEVRAEEAQANRDGVHRPWGRRMLLHVLRLSLPIWLVTTHFKHH